MGGVTRIEGVCQGTMEVARRQGSLKKQLLSRALYQMRQNSQRGG